MNSIRRSAMRAARPLFVARGGSQRLAQKATARAMQQRRGIALVAGQELNRYSRTSLFCSEDGTSIASGRIFRLSRRQLSSELPEHDVVGLPALSPTMEMGTITEWKVKEGEAFAAGDIICMVETDKATVDFEAQDEAVLAKILVPAGTPDVPVGTPMMVLIDSADDVAAFKDFTADGGSSAAPEPEPDAGATAPPAEEAITEPGPATEAAATPEPSTSPATPGGRVAASPLAKKLARDQGYDLSKIEGTGPGGRVIAADVKEFEPAAQTASTQAEGVPATEAGAPAPSPVAGQPSPAGDYVDYPLSEQAQAIAQSLTVSKQTVPHYYLTVDLKLEKLLAIRSTLNEGLPEEEQISLNDMLLKAAAIASQKVPDVNASWMDTFVRQYNTVDVNVMVGVGDGLVAPVVRDVGRRGLKSISDEIKSLATGAQAQTLQPNEVETGTFTVTNLGAYGVKNFAPIVRMPQACALAIGVAEERVIPNEDPDSEDIYQVETMLSATLSCDHRVVDGAVSAQWLAAFRGLVENPLTMLL